MGWAAWDYTKLFLKLVLKGDKNKRLAHIVQIIAF